MLKKFNKTILIAEACENHFGNMKYAKEMVESLEERAIEKEKQRLDNIRNNYLTLENSKKSFDWKTKTYK